MRTPKALFLSVAVLAAVEVVDGLVGVVGAQSNLEPYYQLLRPEGSGPFPALMLVPGSRGVVGNRPQQAEELKKQGYVVIFVDYLSARGLGRRGEVTPQEIAQDIWASVAYLKAQSFVDGSRIGVVGWSRGGRSILASLEEAPIDRPPFRAAAIFYTNCRRFRPWQVRVPVLMLLGAADDAAPPEYCQELAKQLPPDYPINVHVYPDARHSFDRDDLPSIKVRKRRRGTIGHNPETATQAWEEVRKFFAEHLKQP